MIQVVAWLWNDPGYRFNHLFRYGPAHVNTLRSMVRRHLTLDHEFVCITDDPAGIDKDIRVVPLWPDLREMGGCYVRLKAFSEEMAGIIGPRFVWMDVDCVVTGSLDPLFSRTEDFVIWRHKFGAARYCGSMVMMTAGARKQVWEDFDPEFSTAQARALGHRGTDQAWISAKLPCEATWTPADGVLSRYDAGIRGPKEKPAFGVGLPKGARVVFMHGSFDPSQPKLQARHPWIVEHWR